MGRRRKGRPIHGWLVIDKEPGTTSSNVVQRARHILNAQKVGHGGGRKTLPKPHDQPAKRERDDPQPGDEGRDGRAERPGEDRQHEHGPPSELGGNEARRDLSQGVPPEERGRD